MRASISPGFFMRQTARASVAVIWIACLTAMPVAQKVFKNSITSAGRARTCYTFTP